RRRSGDPSRGSILTTVAPRSASRPPASSPATVCASSRTRTPSSVPPRSAPGSADNSVVIVCPSGHPEDARGVLVEPLLLAGVLHRAIHFLVDKGLLRLAAQSRRQADQHLVLDQRVAELHQHLPARAGLTEILRAMRRGVHVKLWMPPHQ